MQEKILKNINVKNIIFSILVVIIILIISSPISNPDSNTILNNDRSENPTTNKTNPNPVGNNTNPNTTTNNTNSNSTRNNGRDRFSENDYNRYSNSTANNTNPNPTANNTNPNPTANNERDRFSENDYNRNSETETNRQFDHTDEYDYDDIYSTSVDSNDTDSSSVDKNRLPNNTIINQTSLKNYDAENFEESSSTDQFFLPNRTINQSDLIEKIRDFRFLLSLADDSNSTCYIVVSRINLLDDSKAKVLSRTPSDLKGNLRVSFEDEQGRDDGGVKKEWFNLLLKKILNPDLGYFCTSQDGLNTLRPSVDGKSKSNYKYFYRFVGRIIGMAILQDCKVTTNFDKMVYKFLLNKEFKFKDLQAVDPSLYNGLTYYLENEIDEELYFVHPYIKDGNYIEKDLIPKGNEIFATNKNMKSYIKLKTEMILFRLIQDQLNAMKKGFNDIIQPYLLNDFTESEFELLLCGISDIDIDDWKSYTNYIDYNSNSQIILWFWRAVNEFTLDQRKKLLQFVTGSDKVPYGGFANLRSDNRSMNFNIAKSIKSSIYLPDAHTCFNRIDIPEYISYNNLKEKLFIAISEGNEGITET